MFNRVRPLDRSSFSVVAASSIGIVALYVSPVFAAEKAPPSLAGAKVPQVHNLANFVVSEDAAIALGKALFWDTQVGSDGQACASCHFHAGADVRVKNQLAPGLRREPDPDTAFQRTASGGNGGPNYTLVEDDFPFHQFHDPNNRHSGTVFSTNDIASSQGTFGGDFDDLPEIDTLNDDCTRYPDPVFHVGGIGTRKVEARQTPTVINAVFAFRNFWDGRANNVFNGVDVFGQRNEFATIVGEHGAAVRIDLRNASLASQSVGPPVDDFEMSCTQRQFADVGAKLLPRRALAMQKVHRSDSVLGGMRDGRGLGLYNNYRELVQAAFSPEYWQEEGLFDGYTQMEANFSLYFGLAVQLYQSTLVSDQALYDDFARGKTQPFAPHTGRTYRLTQQDLRGLDVFIGKGRCVNCHKGADFTGAGLVLQAENEEDGLVERMAMGDGRIALYDNGFYNIGVTPTDEDIGVGGVDPFGQPLSFAKQFVDSHFVDPISVDPCTFEVPFSSDDCSSISTDLSRENLAVRGAFKVPTLRNIELTGPYMHNGSMATLEQVVEFYNRGGNFRNVELDPDIRPLGLDADERAALVAFLRTLTDPRVANESKPFDHPQLFIPHGHPGDEYGVEDSNHDGLADNHLVEIPAIGEHGRTVEGLRKLTGFLDHDVEDAAPPVNGCHDGRPQSLSFVYTGENCAATTNHQGGRFQCGGDADEAAPVQVVVAANASTIDVLPSSQAIGVGDFVSFDNVSGTAGSGPISTLELNIRRNGVTIQGVIIDTSCARPLEVNNRFGSLLLYEYIAR